MRGTEIGYAAVPGHKAGAGITGSTLAIALRVALCCERLWHICCGMCGTEIGCEGMRGTEMGWAMRGTEIVAMGLWGYQVVDSEETGRHFTENELKVASYQRIQLCCTPLAIDV
eukprot:799594-Rhodomonas_salina.3